MGKAVKKEPREAKPPREPAGSSGTPKSRMMMSGAAGLLVGVAIGTLSVLMRLGRDSDPFAKFWSCGAYCYGLTPADRAKLTQWVADSGCREDGGTSQEHCAARPEDICVLTCEQGWDMHDWLPETFPSSFTQRFWSPPAAAEMLAFRNSHSECTARCTEAGMTLGPDASPEEALSILNACGAVFLSPGWAAGSEEIELARLGMEALHVYPGPLKHDHLRDGRTQVFLPFEPPFNSSTLLFTPAIKSLVFGYLKKPMSIDHVSILSSRSGSAAQGMHPDVSYFRATHLSVHTALERIDLQMGPTRFCPCTAVEEPAAFAAALRLATRSKGDCLLTSVTRTAGMEPGAATVYDGLVFHQGGANPSRQDRPILKLELGNLDFIAERNYTRGATAECIDATRSYRHAFGTSFFE
jgi:hypothetical protein